MWMIKHLKQYQELEETKTVKSDKMWVEYFSVFESYKGVGWF